MFKCGDKVRCIHGTGVLLITGSIYTIKDIDNRGYDPLIELEEIRYTRYYSSRFVLVAPEIQATPLSPVFPSHPRPPTPLSEILEDIESHPDSFYWAEDVEAYIVSAEETITSLTNRLQEALCQTKKSSHESAGPTL